MKRWAALVLAALVFTAWTVVWAAREAPGRGEAFPPGSVYNAGDQGLSLALGYLTARSRRGEGPAVQVLARPFLAAQLPSDGVLIRMLPAQEPSALEAAALGDWLARGGRLVLAIDRDFAEWRVAPLDHRGAVTRTFPWPPGVTALRPVPPRGLDPLPAQDSGHTLFLAGAVPVAVRRPVGRGEVIVLACPEVLQDQHLGRGDHLALLEALVGGRPVWFDETVHGLNAPPRPGALLRRWGLVPGLFALALAGALAFWRAAARPGPAAREPADVRTEAVALVDSLAQLYRRALTPQDALAVYAEDLARARQLATAGQHEPAAPPDSRAGAEAALSSDFSTALQQLNQAYERLEHGQRPRHRHRNRRS